MNEPYSVPPARLRLLVLLAPILLAAPGVIAQVTFTNPIRPPESADPWVLHHAGEYYYCVTTGGGVTLHRSRNLHQVATAPGVQVWSMAGSPMRSDIWAPELHHIRGKWYIYTCGNTAGGLHLGPQQMFVLEGDSPDALGAYTFKGIVAEGTPAIDPTPLVAPGDGSLYLVWSQFDAEGQCIYIGPLDDPWTLGTPRLRLSVPTYDWELGGGGRVNEGPEILHRNGKTFIVYSASGCWSREYCLGLLTHTGGDYLDPANWSKSTEPVFQQSEAAGVYGVGHGAFTTSPDGTEWWHVYHGMSDPDGGMPNRSTRMQPFAWRADDTPDFGEPVAAGVALALPSTDGAAGMGLRGEYFDNIDLTGTRVERTDPNINFAWGAGSPIDGIAPDTFSVRWTGTITPPASGTYTFYATTDNGRRLWIDEAPVIDAWVDDWDITYSGTAELTAGQPHALRLEYFENNGGAGAVLEWSGPGLARQIVPATVLRTGEAEPGIANPSFEVDPLPAAPGYTSAITGWTKAGGGLTGLNDASGPFHDNGLIPDGTQVAFIQQAASLSQAVAGFESGRTWRLTVRANTRNHPTGNPSHLRATLGGEVLIDEEVPVVGAGAPYHTFSGQFTPPADGAYPLVLENAPGSGDDLSLLLDHTRLSRSIRSRRRSIRRASRSAPSSGWRPTRSAVGCRPTATSARRGPIAGWACSTGSGTSRRAREHRFTTIRRSSPPIPPTRPGGSITTSTGAGPRRATIVRTSRGSSAATCSCWPRRAWISSSSTSPMTSITRTNWRRSARSPRRCAPRGWRRRPSRCS